MLQFSLTGKVAVVTGAAGILGQKFCEGLVAAGANIALLDLCEKELNDLAKRLRVSNSAARITSHVCNVADPESVTSVVSDVVDIHSAIHVLHNNAAAKSKDLSVYFAPFEEYSLEQWREIMSVNLDGMFLMAQAVGAQMVRQQLGGSIIQTSSIYGVVGPDNRIYEGSDYLGGQINTPAVYAVSKAGVIGLSQYLSTYWASDNIRVNTIVPGGVESGQNNIFKEKYSARVPLGRMAKSTEMVGALVYLASDASSYVTGQVLAIDGGFTAW